MVIKKVYICAMKIMKLNEYHPNMVEQEKIKPFLEDIESAIKKYENIELEPGAIISNFEVKLNFKVYRNTPMGKQDRDFEKTIINVISKYNFLKFMSLNFSNQKKDVGYDTYHFKVFSEYMGNFDSKLLTKFIKFIDKYNIKSEKEFGETICFAARDLNKYAKTEGLDKGDKKLYYHVKDMCIKYLISNGFLEKLYLHEINGTDYYLFVTNVKHEDSYLGKISFHIPEFRFNKFIYTLSYTNISYHNLERVDNEYKKRDTPMVNLEKALDILPFFDSLNNKPIIEKVKMYINNYK
jgi:hypothetical protein